MSDNTGGSGGLVPGGAEAAGQLEGDGGPQRVDEADDGGDGGGEQQVRGGERGQLVRAPRVVHVAGVVPRAAPRGHALAAGVRDLERGHNNRVVNESS